MINKEYYSRVPHLELHYLDLIQNRFDSKAIAGAVATIERRDERVVVFGLRHRLGGSAVTVQRSLIYFTDDVISVARLIADELINRFNTCVGIGKEKDLIIAPMMERAEKAGYRADFTFIDEWSDHHA